MDTEWKYVMYRTLAEFCRAYISVKQLQMLVYSIYENKVAQLVNFSGKNLIVMLESEGH